MSRCALPPSSCYYVLSASWIVKLLHRFARPFNSNSSKLPGWRSNCEEVGDGKIMGTELAPGVLSVSILAPRGYIAQDQTGVDLQEKKVKCAFGASD